MPRWDDKLRLSRNTVIRPLDDGMFELQKSTDTINSNEVDINALRVVLFFDAPHTLREAYATFGPEFKISQEDFGAAMEEILGNEILLPVDSAEASKAVAADPGRLLTDLVDRAQELKADRAVQDLIAEGRLEIGRRSYGWHWARYYIHGVNPSKIVIGSFCSIGQDAAFVSGGDHPVAWVSTYFSGRPELCKNTHPIHPGVQQSLPPRDIVIGSDVWIATQAMILGGVTLGHGAVVTARSVVTRDVPPFAIVGGSPAKLIRYRFAPEIIAKLLALRWWDWPFAKIQEALPLLNGPDIQGFLEKYAG